MFISFLSFVGGHAPGHAFGVKGQTAVVSFYLVDLGLGFRSSHQGWPQASLATSPLVSPEEVKLGDVARVCPVTQEA